MDFFYLTKISTNYIIKTSSNDKVLATFEFDIKNLFKVSLTLGKLGWNRPSLKLRTAGRLGLSYECKLGPQGYYFCKPFFNLIKNLL
jgi:hypothetical protein